MIGPFGIYCHIGTENWTCWTRNDKALIRKQQHNPTSVYGGLLSPLFGEPSTCLFTSAFPSTAKVKFHKGPTHLNNLDVWLLMMCIYIYMCVATLEMNMALNQTSVLQSVNHGSTKALRLGPWGPWIFRWLSYLNWLGHPSQKNMRVGQYESSPIELNDKVKPPSEQLVITSKDLK